MTTETKSLSPEQKELVAVGASVGAGCHPCVAHHLKAAAKAGLDGGRLLAALASAERIASEAAVLVADHARGKLDPAATPATPAPLDDALASFGAALGANDATGIDFQLRAALDLGASRSQLEEAIETARNVQENAIRIHVREAERLLDSLATQSAAPESEADSGEGCGCGSDDEDVEADDDTTETASDRQPAVEAGLAGWFASAGAGTGPAAMIDHCRELFAERCGPPSAPARSEQTASPAAAGCAGGKEGGR